MPDFLTTTREQRFGETIHATMSTFPESALIAAGFLRRRCREAVNLECPSCGTTLHGLSIADCANGMDCGTCGQRSPQPRLKCARCKKLLPSLLLDAERDCRSVEAYRKGNCAPAFAPDEPLWAFKRSARGHEEVVSESELRRRFSSGELDASVLVRSANQDRYAKADACAEFRDAARATHPRPESSTHMPLPPAVSLPQDSSAGRFSHRPVSIAALTVAVAREAAGPAKRRFFVGVIAFLAMLALWWICSFIFPKIHIPGFAQLHHLTIPAAQSQPIRAIAISHQGDMLLSSSQDGTLTLREFSSGAKLQTLAEPSESTFIWSLSFSPDGRRVAWGDSEGYTVVYDVKENGMVFGKRYRGYHPAVTSVAFSPSGGTIALVTGGTLGGDIVLIDGSGEVVRETRFSDYADLRSVAFSPSGELLAVGGYIEGIHLFSTLNLKLVRRIGNDFVDSVAFSADGNVISGRELQSVCLWDTATGNERCRLIIHDSDSVASFALSPDSRHVAVASSKGFSLWDTMARRFVVRNRGSEATAVTFSPDGRWVASAGTGSTIDLWELPVDPN